MDEESRARRYVWDFDEVTFDEDDAEDIELDSTPESKKKSDTAT